MADATDAPGIKRRPRKDSFAYYWIPPARDVLAGYRPRSIALNPAFTADERAAECRRLWAQLEAWRSGQDDGPTLYSISWLIRRYQGDELSPYRRLRARTKRSYDYLCRYLDAQIGQRQLAPRVVGRSVLPNITGESVLRWHRAWSKFEDGLPTTPSAARHAITMLRTLARYAVVIAVPGAREFKDLLSTMEFPVTAPREIAPTREQVKAIVDQAQKDGYLSIAIATQAQFDLIERRTHIIGTWEGTQWRPGWVWQNINDWTITYYQTKSGLVLRQFDLRTTPRLLELLRLIPDEERVGAVIKCERMRGSDNKAPWNERHYATVFREICRRAGVSDEIKSMDMRAGGATEADGIADVSDRMLQDALGHADPRTKDRYRRAKQRNAQNVVALRQARNKSS